MPLGHTLNFLFLKIFSRKLKKLSLLFQFSRNFFLKMEINVCPRAHISKIHFILKKQTHTRGVKRF